MNVETLIKTLQTIGPNARVVLAAMPRQQELDNGAGACGGDIVYVTVAEVDGADTLVTLTNCVSNAQGDLAFDVEPQFKRFCVSTRHGLQAAAADFQEQAGSEPTQDLSAHLDVESIKSLFQSLNQSTNG